MNEKKISETMYHNNVWSKPNYTFQPNSIKRGFYNFLSRRKFILFRFIRSIPENSKVLDWGCGHGFLTLPLKKELKYKVYGCDIVSSAISNLQKYSTKIDIPLNLMLVSPDKLNYPSNFFDAVVSSDVFEHVSKPEACLKEIYRILKPGGIFALHTGSKHYQDQFVYKKIIRLLGYDPWGEAIGHINLHYFDSLVAMFKNAKFSVEQNKSPVQYLGAILAKNIVWCFNEQQLGNRLWFRIIKFWHKHIFTPRCRFINLFLNLLLAIEEEMEIKFFRKNGGSIYFKLKK